MMLLHSVPNIMGVAAEWDIGDMEGGQYGCSVSLTSPQTSTCCSNQPLHSQIFSYVC